MGKVLPGRWGTTPLHNSANADDLNALPVVFAPTQRSTGFALAVYRCEYPTHDEYEQQGCTTSLLYVPRVPDDAAQGLRIIGFLLREAGPLLADMRKAGERTLARLMLRAHIRDLERLSSSRADEQTALHHAIISALYRHASEWCEQQSATVPTMPEYVLDIDLQ